MVCFSWSCELDTGRKLCRWSLSIFIIAVLCFPYGVSNVVFLSEITLIGFMEKVILSETPENIK